MLRRCSECCFKRHLHLKNNSKLIFGKGVLKFMFWLSQTIQYRTWPPRLSLEYLLNYKIFPGFPSLDKAAKDFTGPVSQHLVPDSLLWLEAMQINFHIFQGSSISKSSIFWKEIFISTERKNIHSFWQVGYFKWGRNSIFLHRKLNPNCGLCHCFKSSVIALWNFPSFRVSQFVKSLEPPAQTFYNLVLVSIYVNDGTTI